MNIYYEEHRLILTALIKHNVSFMLIGGYAVNYYGYNRSTGDMDIWIQPDNGNKEFMLTALSSLGFDEEGIATIRSWNFTQPQKFYIGNANRPDKTEFMTHISGIKYSEASSLKIVANMEGINLPLIHYSSLIQNKKSAGRLKDLADIEHLEKIMELKNKK
jgi:hypothetical protein